MANFKTCKECGQHLLADDISLHRKLIDRSADEFFCIDCLVSKLHITREYAERLIDYYRRTGNCTLFV